MIWAALAGLTLIYAFASWYVYREGYRASAAAVSATYLAALAIVAYRFWQ